MTPNSRHRPESERGAALLSVLLLVAVMAVIAAVMLERLNLSARLAGNGQAMTQARLYATSGEALAMAKLKALVDSSPQRTVDTPGILGRDIPLPLQRGTVIARIEDAGNCFNVNSLVEGQDGEYSLRPAALDQMRALMASLQIDEGEATRISDAVADWIDSDDRPAPNGAEDQYYSALPVPYRTPGRLIGDVSELRAVRDMTPVIYQRLRPWLCALPTAQLSPININTLRPEQARLVAMLSPTLLPVDRVRAVLMQRPALGWASSGDFLRPFSSGTDGDAVAPVGQLQVTSRWFLLDLTARVDSIQLDESALVDVGVTPARVAFRTWGDRDSR